MLNVALFLTPSFHDNPEGDQLSDDEADKLLNRRSFKPKPLIISLDVNKDCKFQVFASCLFCYESVIVEITNDLF